MFVPLHLPMITQRYPFLALCLALVLASVVACSNSGEEMHRQLNELQARNQVDSVLSDTATAMALTTYFDDNGTQNERLEAHYLLARTWTDLGQAPRALEEYQNAAALADTTNLDSLGNHWLSRIYGHMGELLFTHQLPKNALEAYKKAYRHALQAKETIVSVVFYEQLGKCYYDLNLEDSTALVIEKTIDMYLAYGDTLDANTVKGAMAYMLIKNRDFDKAKSYLDDYEYRSLLSLQASDLREEWKLLYYYKGYYHQSIGNTDSALYYFNRELELSIQSNNKGLAYKGLYQVYNTLNKPDSVAKYSLLYAELTNSAYEQSSYAVLANSQQLYNYNRYKSMAQQKTIEVERARLTNLYIVFSCLFAVSIIVFFFYHYENRRKMIRQRINTKYATDMILYTKLKARLEQSDDLNQVEKQKLQEELSLIKEYLQEEQTDSLNPDQWDVPDVLLESSIVTMFHKAAAQGRTVTGDSSWTALRQACHKYLPEFMNYVDSIDSSKYKTDYIDIQICILTKMRFSISEIQTLLQLSSSNFSKRRSRLYKKLKGKEGSSTDLDKYIRSI